MKDMKDIAKIAETLCRTPVRNVSAVGGGGNNRVYRIDGDGGTFACKGYPSSAEDTRDRLGTEFNALKFLHGHGLSCVPEAIACDRENGFALYQWVEGEAIPSPDAADIDQALDFVERLKTVSGEPEAQALADASEACLSADALVGQIEWRFERLKDISGPALQEFLNGRLNPAFQSFLQHAVDGYQNSGLDFKAPIDARARTLSPSDFGFHNALRRSDGGIVFIDFEYFGWDDPMKLHADFLLHPGMALRASEKKRFSDGTRRIFTNDKDFSDRVGFLLPLVGIRWCLIVLNEFLPDYRERRSIDAAADLDGIRAGQLEKSGALLNRLLENDI